MTEKRANRPVVFHKVKLRPVHPGEDVRWKSLCADHPEVDPRLAERFLARLPQALIDDCEDRHLIDLMRRWESALGDPPVALTLTPTDNGFSCAVMSESHRGAVACVAAVLEGEGIYFTGLQLWNSGQPPRADAAERPLFVIEADLAGSLPEGILTIEDLTQRLLTRLQQALKELTTEDSSPKRDGVVGRVLASLAPRLSG